MKLNTVMGYPHKAGLLVARYRLDPNTNIKVPYWATTPSEMITCRFIVPSGTSGGRTSKMYSTWKLASLDRLLSPKDAGGTAIFDEANTLGYEITTVAPVINMLGYVDCYAYGVKRLVNATPGAAA